MKRAGLKQNGYPGKLWASLQSLWDAKERLSLRHIRPGFLRYFFAFPLAMVFVNVQDLLLGEGVRIFGLSYTTVTFLAFAAGAVILFALSTQKNISAVCKSSAVITAAGFAAWLFLPDGYPSLAGALVLMIGVGGCVSSGSFSFVFVLNNAERFFGAALMLLSIKLIELSAVAAPLPPAVQKILAAILIVPLCFCMYSSKSEDHSNAAERTAKKFEPGIWLTLFLILAYFAIRITGFYAPAFGHPPSALAWGILALALLLVCIIQQVLLRRSVWTLCNVFFLSSILSYVMWYLKIEEAAYLFSELKDVGLLITFYLIGCVTNKFCDFTMHKRLVLLCMTAIGLLYAGIDALHARMLDQSVAIVTAALLFIVFLLLSPFFSQHLFFADWSEEFRRVRMSFFTEDALQKDMPEQGRAPSLDDTSLSPREKQVVWLLLQGMTLRQVAPELGLTVSTVSTYAKSIYKKLDINSRAELFLLFGRAGAADPPRAEKKDKAL